MKLEDRFSRWWELLNRPIRPTDDGDASGTLRFARVPRYDGRKREISVPGLDYELETDSRLVNAYVWLRSDELWDVFRSRAQLSVASAGAWAYGERCGRRAPGVMRSCNHEP